MHLYLFIKDKAYWAVLDYIIAIGSPEIHANWIWLSEISHVMYFSKHIQVNAAIKWLGFTEKILWTKYARSDAWVW